MNDSQRLQYVGERDVILDGTRGRCVCDRETGDIRSCERETRVLYERAASPAQRRGFPSAL